MAKKTYQAPTQCPVCGERMQVTGLRCAHCGTEIKNSFEPCRFCALDEKNLQFVEVFLKCRGSIKEVEKALGVSYPTVKNMLDNALEALHLDDAGATPAQAKEERAEILRKISSKEMDVGAAIEALNRLKGGR